MDEVEIWEVLVMLSGNEISLKEAHTKICSLLGDGGTKFNKMRSLYRLEERAEREIELIEQDDSMDAEEKRQAIKEIYAELREIERDMREDERW